MGQSKGGGYEQLGAMNQGQSSLLAQLLSGAGSNLGSGGNLSQNPLYQQAVNATQQMLPGGNGFAPIQQQAMNNYQQNTVPSLLNSLGSNAKSSSALNQALAASAGDLNTNLAAQQSQMQLGAAGQAANLAQMPFQQGLQASQVGLGTSPFAYGAKQLPFWQQMLLGGIQASGKAAGSMAGSAAFL